MYEKIDKPLYFLAKSCISDDPLPIGGFGAESSETPVATGGSVGSVGGWTGTRGSPLKNTNNLGIVQFSVYSFLHTFDWLPVLPRAGLHDLQLFLSLHFLVQTYCVQTLL